jgi:hypothetical protein
MLDRSAVYNTIVRNSVAYNFIKEEYMSESWLPTLRTENPEEGFQLAIKLSRVGVKMTQPSAEVREKLRPEYAENPDSLIATSQVIAINFQTVALANDHWRS